MTQRYAIYWLLPNGTRVYHLDEAFGTPWKFDTYEQCYQVGQRLSRPSIDAKLMFEVV